MLTGKSQHPSQTHFRCFGLTLLHSDGKADYVWTRPLDGQVQVWLNKYPQLPAWKHIGVVKDGVGTSGANIRLAPLTGTKQHPGSGRADYVAVNPGTGAIVAWLNGCDDRV